MMLVFTTGCSTQIPNVNPPTMMGNCHEDLYNVWQYYIIPMEAFKNGVY